MEQYTFRAARMHRDLCEISVLSASLWWTDPRIKRHYLFNTTL
jgi:hypothetical protein